MGTVGQALQFVLSPPLIGRCEQLISVQPLCDGSPGLRRLCASLPGTGVTGNHPHASLFRHPEDDADTSVTTSWDGRRVNTFVYVPIIRCAPDPCLA